jgi:hypothetical protein
MTERDIRGYVLALVGAIQTDDNETAKNAIVALGTQVLVDLNHIANALEEIAIKMGS